MGRIMSIDFGTKRMGIAVTDPLKIIASGLDTVGSEKIMTYLESYFIKEEVECLVIGSPGAAGRGGDIATLADEFCKKVSEKFPSLRIERIDEFYTSKIAERTILQSGIGKMARRDKGLVDKVLSLIHI